MRSIQEMSLSWLRNLQSRNVVNLSSKLEESQDKRGFNVRVVDRGAYLPWLLLSARYVR